MKARGSAGKVESGLSHLQGADRRLTPRHYFLPRRNMNFPIGTPGVKLTRAFNIGKIVVYRLSILLRRPSGPNAMAH
jgi:hypothetical protein